MISVCILVIAASIISLQFKTTKSEYGILISLAATIFIFIISISNMKIIVELVQRISNITSINDTYIKILLKITGITFVCEIASDIAKDCGYQALANETIICGKISVLAISMPVFLELINSLGNILS